MNRLLRPGFRFRDGHLIVSTEEEVKIIESWPSLKAIRKAADHKAWSQFVPVFRLLRPKAAAGNIDSLGPEDVQSTALDPAFEKQLAFAHFRSSVPLEITKSVERFSSRQWLLLALCKRRERAKDLLEQNPALGFGVAHLHKFCPAIWEPINTAAKVSALRQRDMLGWLRLPKTQAWVNILAKIPPGEVTLERLKLLGELAKDPEAEKKLQHLQFINGRVIDLVTEPRFAGLIAPTLLAEIAESSDDMIQQESNFMLNDVFYIGVSRLGQRIQPIRSLQYLRAKHREVEEAFEQFLKREAEEVKGKVFPPPPLPGTAEIVPLTTSDELVQEGKAQHNCAGGYAEWVHDGQGYLYRVLSPERATLSIIKGADGCWCINQLKLACNQTTSIKTHQAVLAWLSQFSLSV